MVDQADLMIQSAEDIHHVKFCARIPAMTKLLLAHQSGLRSSLTTSIEFAQDSAVVYFCRFDYVTYIQTQY